MSVRELNKNFPEIEIRGNPIFKYRTKKAIELIKNETPDTYKMVAEFIAIIRQGKQSGMWAFENPPAFEVGNLTYMASRKWYASTIVHDAYHSKLFHTHRREHNLPVPRDVWTGKEAEMKCMDVQEEFLIAVRAPRRTLEHLNRKRTEYFWEIPARHW